MQLQTVRIKLKADVAESIDSLSREIVDTAVSIGGKSIATAIPMPARTQKWTVLRSPHVNKKSRDQFERRVHYRLVTIENCSAQIIEALTDLGLAARAVKMTIKVMEKNKASARRERT